jgi:hypothetical protein
MSGSYRQVARGAELISVFGYFNTFSTFIIPETASINMQFPEHVLEA